MTREQAQAYMCRLNEKERQVLEDLMAALSPKGCAGCPVQATEKEQRKEKEK